MLRIDMQATGQLIRDKCDRVGIKPTELCRQFNLDATTPYYWFAGKSLPRMETFVNLADMLGCEITDLYVLEKEEDDEEDTEGDDHE